MKNFGFFSNITIKLKSKIKARLIASIVVFLCFSIILASFIYLESKAQKKEIEIQATKSFATFKEHTQTFIQNKVALLNSVSSFFTAIDNPSDFEIRNFLDSLLKKEVEVFRNVGYIKDTTYIWSHPLETNEAIIGVDLLSIPEQKDNVLKAKKTMQYTFEGPVNLIQGGTGYIIRIPFEQDNEYAGMVSAVLKSDKLVENLDNFSEISGLKIAIVDNSRPHKIIYGSKKTIENSNFIFTESLADSIWDFYIIPSTDNNHSHLFFIIVVSALWFVLAITGSMHMYKFLKSSAELKQRNDFLSMAIMKDELTNLYNRKYLDARLLEEIENLNRYGGILSIVFFDLDFFKKVNDTYGHAQGDKVLVEISTLIKPLLRGGDVFGRWGGEEFLILLPGTPLAKAQSKAETLRSFLEYYRHSVAGKITASFGVAEYIKNEFIGSFFNRVDNALYRAKETGRNQIQISNPSTNDPSVLIRTRWKFEWLCGNDSIDNDHKRLLIKGNEFIEGAYLDKDSCLKRAESFLNFTKAHFENEEKILASKNFKLLEEHKKIHSNLISATSKMFEKLKDKDIDPIKIFRFVQDQVIVGHLLKEDIKFFSLFK